MQVFHQKLILLQSLIQKTNLSARLAKRRAEGQQNMDANKRKGVTETAGKFKNGQKPK